MHEGGAECAQKLHGKIRRETSGLIVQLVESGTVGDMSLLLNGPATSIPYKVSWPLAE